MHQGLVTEGIRKLIPLFTPNVFCLLGCCLHPENFQRQIFVKCANEGGKDIFNTS